jgi:hypothetical protein
MKIGVFTQRLIGWAAYFYAAVATYLTSASVK